MGKAELDESVPHFGLLLAVAPVLERFGAVKVGNELAVLDGDNDEGDNFSPDSKKKSGKNAGFMHNVALSRFPGVGHEFPAQAQT